ncbi:MAG TPA: helix-turn-helix domain-containing protein [Acidimicrobiales bacterium]|nr:helix-turn-helix domain-containing protein [Acidimicrobiales bacterium]
MSARSPEHAARRPPADDAGEDAGQQSTRRVVIDAAVACILERGFYRASSNEIARRAGVTWGVIQHHFGTREALLLAVLEDGAQRFTELVSSASIEGDTVAERLAQLVDVLAVHYGSPAYLAYMQINLNLGHDPSTSTTVRATMTQVAERSSEHMRALVRDTLGPATGVADLSTTVWLALRGFLVSQQLLHTLAYDSVVPESDRVARQRRLLIEMLAPYLEQVAAQRA